MSKTSPLIRPSATFSPRTGRRISIDFVLIGLFLLIGCRNREEDSGPRGVPVRVEIAKRGDFAPVVKLLGVTRASETVPLTAVRGGVVRYAPRFRDGVKTGARIERGDLIATIDNEQVRFALTQTRLALDGATADLERMQRSFDSGIISNAELAGAKARAALARAAFRSAQREASEMALVAPRAGTLVVKHRIANGVTVAPSTVVADIASGGQPLVECSVSSSDRSRLRPGMSVRLAMPGDASWLGEGIVREVSSVLDDAGTATVIASLSTASVIPPPGTGVEVTVDLGKRTDAVTVPENAIVVSGGGPAVYVVIGRGTYLEPARVKRVGVDVGGRANGRAEIRNGLHDGDRVVVAGVEAMSDGADVFEVQDEKQGGQR